jgi:hypothetical protein
MGHCHDTTREESFKQLSGHLKIESNKKIDPFWVPCAKMDLILKPNRGKANGPLP